SISAAVAFAGAASLTAVATTAGAHEARASFDGAGVFAASGQRGRVGAAAFSGAGALTAVGARGIEAAMAMAAAGDLALAATRGAEGAASLIGVGALTAAGTVETSTPSVSFT